MSGDAVDARDASTSHPSNGRQLLSRQLREFIVDRTGGESGAGAGTSGSVGKLADALQPRFKLSAGRPAAVRHVWLDTFDWRLHRTGVTLEYSIRSGSYQLSLVTREGVRTAAVPRLTLPALAEQLPAGPVRDLLAPITGIRALLPVVSTVGTRRELRVLDQERKTIAYLTVDETTVPEMDATAPSPRLAIVAVRGYEAQADRIERLIAGLPGVAAANGSAFRAALAAAGLDAGSYTS